MCKPMYPFVRICIYIYIYTYIHTCTHIQTHVRIHKRIRICTHPIWPASCFAHFQKHLEGRVGLAVFGVSVDHDIERNLQMNNKHVCYIGYIRNVIARMCFIGCRNVCVLYMNEARVYIYIYIYIHHMHLYVYIHTYTTTT